MIQPTNFLTYLESLGIGFFTGVPDSQLKQVCEEIYYRYGYNSKKHIVAVNEGNAVGLAAGYFLATGNIPLVYLQNSGLGNAVNPITSLADPEVYGIPIIYLVGWRGEPGVHDEPQHIKQGAITLALLDVLGIASQVIAKETKLDDLKSLFTDNFMPLLRQGKSVALVVRKGAFSKSSQGIAGNLHTMGREEAITCLAERLGETDYVVSTTGKISRELFEYCKRNNQNFTGHTFLTVGSMGHASAIAYSIALQHPTKTVWCFDGDGAVLMHMGSLSTIGTMAPKNLMHVVFNNEAHESVGAMPTVAGKVDLAAVATACGYKTVQTLASREDLCSLAFSQMQKPCMLQLMVSTGSRDDLIRPDTTPQHNKEEFMKVLEV